MPRSIRSGLRFAMQCQPNLRILRQRLDTIDVPIGRGIFLGIQFLGLGQRVQSTPSFGQVDRRQRKPFGLRQRSTLQGTPAWAAIRRAAFEIVSCRLNDRARLRPATRGFGVATCRCRSNVRIDHQGRDIGRSARFVRRQRPCHHVKFAVLQISRGLQIMLVAAAVRRQTVCRSRRRRRQVVHRQSSLTPFLQRACHVDGQRSATTAANE